MITLLQDNKFMGFVEPDGANGIDTDDLKKAQEVSFALLRHMCYIVKQVGFKLATDIEEPAGGVKESK